MQVLITTSWWKCLRLKHDIFYAWPIILNIKHSQYLFLNGKHYILILIGVEIKDAGFIWCQMVFQQETEIKKFQQTRHVYYFINSAKVTVVWKKENIVNLDIDLTEWDR